jgi:hypothetical protein
MTLNTSVAIHGAYNVQEIYAHCRMLLNTPEDVEPWTGPDEGQERSYRHGQRWIGNPGGIGLPAWLQIYYGVDGPMTHRCDKWCSTELGGEWGTTQDQIDEHDRDVATDPTANGWAGIEVTFDTTYSYRGENDEGCSALHARLVAQLGAWLDSRGLEWKWQNEYTGEWFDRYDQLAEFAGYHESSGADDWFRNVAQPAIAMHIAASELGS